LRYSKAFQRKVKRKKNHPNDMKRALLYIILFCLCSSAGAQTIKDLNKAARDNSGKRPQVGGGQYAGSNDAFAAYMLVRSFIWMGQGMLQLGKEQSRLAKRNKEENHLYSLEIRPQAGYGLRSFVRLQPQARANLGCISVDLKQTILQDANAEFKTLGLMFWMNFWNRGRFRLRGGAGSLGINTSGETFFQYGIGAEFHPNPKVRLELEANQTERIYGTETRPFRDLNFKVHYHFWTKGILQASVFGGACSQQFYNGLDFTSLDAGLNFRLSASKFKHN